MDQHNDEAGARYERLEQRLAEFIEKLSCVSADMENIKKQQADLIKLIQQKLGDKK